VTGARGGIRRGLEYVESALGQIFSGSENPMHQLGALGWFFFWIVIVTGIYLYIFFDSGVTQAYQSVESLTVTQWYAGGIMRSLHRYASDALVIVMMLHLLREFAYGRYGGVRWFTWITGIPLIWFLFAAGISGYWVVWDRLAQYLAVSTMEWIDTLPLFAEPIARNFMHSDALSGRFFTLLVFIHIAVPLFMLFMMWIHIQRLAQPRVNPPRTLALGALSALVLLSLAAPVRSQGPANLDTVPAVLNLDWYYMGIYPLLDRFGGGWMWVLAFGATVALLIVPWLFGRDRPPVAVVDLDNCNGCSRCFLDCPYGAINMQPRSDGKAYALEAVVSADRCVACGICVGSCPTATPFRRRTELVPGIDLAGTPLASLRSEVIAASERLKGENSVMIFGCAHGPDMGGSNGENVAALRIECVGMLPPAFIDFVLSRKLARGVMLAGCREGNCYHRLGDRWTRARVARSRDPYMRSRVPADRLRTCWAGGAGQSRLARELDLFRIDLGSNAESTDDSRA